MRRERRRVFAAAVTLLCTRATSSGPQPGTSTAPAEMSNFDSGQDAIEIRPRTYAGWLWIFQSEVAPVRNSIFLLPRSNPRNFFDCSGKQLSDEMAHGPRKSAKRRRPPICIHTRPRGSVSAFLTRSLHRMPSCKYNAFRDRNQDG